MFAPPSPLAQPKPASRRGGEAGKSFPFSIYLHPAQLLPGPKRRPATRPAGLRAMPNEPEDARITGGTRSLDRRLLALNLSGSRSCTTQPAPLRPLKLA